MLARRPGWLAAAPLAAAERPNVIVVLVDELGHPDLGCQGNTFHEAPTQAACPTTSQNHF
jgi:hypothetical protein